MTDQAISTVDRLNELRFVVVGNDERGFIAVRIERYIAAQGKNVDEVQNRLRIAYRAELDDSVARTGKPFGDIPPAPDKYRAMFEDNDGCVERGTIFDSRPYELVQIAA